MKELVPTLDEAWAARGLAETDDPLAYVVDLHRPIGVNGETRVRIVVLSSPDGTLHELITAFPY